MGFSVAPRGVQCYNKDILAMPALRKEAPPLPESENRTALSPDTPVQSLKGVGPKLSQLFEKLGIRPLADLL